MGSDAGQTLTSPPSLDGGKARQGVPSAPLLTPVQPIFHQQIQQPDSAGPPSTSRAQPKPTSHLGIACTPPRSRTREATSGCASSLLRELLFSDSLRCPT